MTDESMIAMTWPDWEVMELLGRGNCGAVYSVRRRDVPDVEAAVKVIPIPKDESEILALRSEGFTDGEIEAMFRKETEDMTSEILMMKKFQGMSHFVSIEDCKVVKHPEDAPGSRILIRMEKLKSFPDYSCDKTLTEPEIIDLGIQLCDALADCHADHIIHRDIKPANIFVNDRSSSGVLFKLGDFGVSRKLGITASALSMKGALGYMSPEMIQGLPYDERTDIYSLGLTLYKLMNGNRFPFMPDRRLFSMEDYALAQQSRMLGTEFPPAANASDALNRVLRRACAFHPEDRYPSAEAMSRALSSVLNAGTAPAAADREEQVHVKKTRRWIIGACAGLAAVLILALFPGRLMAGKTLSSPAATAVPMLPVADRRTQSSAVTKAMAGFHHVWQQALNGGESSPQELLETLPFGALLNSAPEIAYERGSQAVRIDGADDSWSVLVTDDSGQIFDCAWDPVQKWFMPDRANSSQPESIQSIGIRFRIPAFPSYLQVLYWYAAEPSPVFQEMEVLLEKGDHSAATFFSRLSRVPEGLHCTLWVNLPDTPTQQAEAEWSERSENK